MLRPWVLIVASVAGCVTCPLPFPEVDGGTPAVRERVTTGLRTILDAARPSAQCISRVTIRPTDPTPDTPHGTDNYFDPNDASIVIREQAPPREDHAYVARHEACHAVDRARRLTEGLLARGIDVPRPPDDYHPDDTAYEAWAFACTPGIDTLGWRLTVEEVCGHAPGHAALRSAHAEVALRPAPPILAITDEGRAVAPDERRFTPTVWLDDDGARIGLSSTGSTEPQHGAIDLSTGVVRLVDGDLPVDWSPTDTTVPEASTFRLPMVGQRQFQFRSGLGYAATTTGPLDPWDPTWPDAVVALVRTASGLAVADRCADADALVRMDQDRDGRLWVFEVPEDGAEVRWYRIVDP